jgi:hypothetical protein
MAQDHSSAEAAYSQFAAMRRSMIMKPSRRGRRVPGRLWLIGSRGLATVHALPSIHVHLANRTPEALAAIGGRGNAERSGERCYYAELHRLRGMFLANLGAEETQIEASFCAAISTAKEQKSISLAKRAEATYAEYHRLKAEPLGEHRFRAIDET